MVLGPFSSRSLSTHLQAESASLHLPPLPGLWSVTAWEGTVGEEGIRILDAWLCQRLFSSESKQSGQDTQRIQCAQLRWQCL